MFRERRWAGEVVNMYRLNQDKKEGEGRLNVARKIVAAITFKDMTP